MGVEKSERTRKSLFWGRMEGADLSVRVAALVFVVVSIAAMSFCQLGFWPIGVIDDKPVYLMLVLAPIAMGAFMFGSFTGVLIGLYAGVVLLVHATFFPLDYYEVYFMTPLNALLLPVIAGLASGWLLDFVTRRKVTGVMRLGLIVAASLVVSFVSSELVMLNMLISYGTENLESVQELLFNSPLGVTVQSLVDAVLVMVLCMGADEIVLKHVGHTGWRGRERTLLSVFRNWMLLVSSVVFMIASSIVFSHATVQAQSQANEAMRSEVDYLQTQIASLEVGEGETLAEGFSILLDGYRPELDGSVCIMDENGAILATNDAEHFPVGRSYAACLGYEGSGSASGYSSAGLLDSVLENDGAATLQGADEDGAQSLNFVFLVCGAYGGAAEGVSGEAAGDAVDSGEVKAQAEEGSAASAASAPSAPAAGASASAAGASARDGADVRDAQGRRGYISIVRPDSMVFANRFDTMLIMTLLAIALIASMAVLATILLSSVVVRRIDETNGSLRKITDGDLTERVRVSDTREFTSLSTGINTTVSALKDTIDEVKQRNAQDLATAKTIQESALPREFPPFPQIDKFDIYASMKTAKEVGGDFYDFFLIGDEGEKLGFVMADVSGKGIPAALFMMTAKTQIRNYMEAGFPLDEAIDAANHQLCIGNDAGMFVTAWVGVLDYGTGELVYVNAGHNPPMLHSDGSWEWLKNVSGMPLGLFDGIPYEAFARKLDVGDMLYLYTDGVTEAMDAGGNLFGEERLESVLREFAHMNPRSVGVGVRRALTDFTLDAEQSDDITMLALKYGVPPEKKAVMVLPAIDTQLVHVYNFIHEELHRRNAPRSAYNPLDIAAEELFVNVCHYAYPDATPENPGEVRISFEYEANPPQLSVQIADDGIPYDPLAKPDAVTPDDIADVPIGGLGILMAKQSVDEMTYERVGDSNVLTFVKRW